MTRYYVYIMTNRSGTLYIGVTRDLLRRVHEHKSKLVDAFTKRYNIDRLMYHETTEDVQSAIARERQLKGWTRKKKLGLINAANSRWRDLSEGWYD